MARDPEWSKKLDQAETDAEEINVLREFTKAKRHSFKEEKLHSYYWGFAYSPDLKRTCYR